MTHKKSMKHDVLGGADARELFFTHEPFDRRCAAWNLIL
jgi:hypothetical protein